jgi:hypothetical protein
LVAPHAGQITLRGDTDFTLTHLRQFRGHFDWFYSVRVRENLKM